MANEQIQRYADQIAKDAIKEDHAGNLPNELEGLANQITAHLRAAENRYGRTSGISQDAILRIAAEKLKVAAAKLREIDKAADQYTDPSAPKHGW